MTEIGLSIEEVSEHGKTPLYLGTVAVTVACMRGYWKEFEREARYNTIKLLLDAGANPKARNTKTLMTCIHWAGFHTIDLNSLQALVEKVSIEDVFLQDSRKMTALDIAGIKAKSDQIFLTLDYLLQCAEEYFTLYTNPVNSPDENTATIKTKLKAYSEQERMCMKMLYWAAYRDKKEFAVKIIRTGISPFVEFMLNESAIVSAIQGGAYNTVKAMIDLNYQLDNGQTYNIRNERNSSFE